MATTTKGKRTLTVNTKNWDCYEPGLKRRHWKRLAAAAPDLLDLAIMLRSLTLDPIVGPEIERIRRGSGLPDAGVVVRKVIGWPLLAPRSE